MSALAEDHRARQIATLVRMANQIGTFFAAYPEDKARPQVTDHLKKFWDPHMRRTLKAHAEAGGEGLTPLTRAAVLDLA